MKLPRLDEEVAFDAPTRAPDGSGGVEVGWTAPVEAYVCPASFRFLRGGETVQAARLAGRQPVVVTIRANPDARRITPDWRMRDNRRGTVYQIRTVIEVPGRMWMEITAESGVAV